MVTIVDIDVQAIAAPPTGFGGDARNIAQGGPTYANVVLEIITDKPGLVGTGVIFTNGHGLMETCGVTRSVATRFLLDKDAPVDVDHLHENGNLGRLGRAMLQDSDYAWLGGVGISRMAIGAVINALWDLAAKCQGLPAWELIARMAPADLIQFIDFEPIADVLSPAEAYTLLEEAQEGKDARIADVYERGLLAYNTAGWSGISTDALVKETEKMIHAGWPQIKVKVGSSWSERRINAQASDQRLDREELDQMALAAAEEDAERLILVYETIDKEDSRSTKMLVAVDSNQVFDTRSAIVFIKHLAERLYRANPRYQIAWFEEPANQHSAISHVAIQQALNRAFADYDPPLRVPISTGEQGSSPVVFKDLLFAPDYEGNDKHYAIDVIQMDYARVAGICDNLAILLLAIKARREGRDVRICPHTGGIGLCEGMRQVQAIKQALFGRANNAGVDDILEFVAEESRSVHEGVFKNPAIVEQGYYQMNKTPGVGVDYTTAGKTDYLLPEGKAWQAHDEHRARAQAFTLSGKRFQ
ncbi:enolase C-terminal domain-like protein [Marinimicrobium alkaliphilum]|uniref:enolase C-terminal domain-like protein n=1 Tax=Marinimicrobium alkaliphilum TaxID=2202654 RepID=UPI0018E0882C|nr:enolase C-terminal domain-like protein [Marinimicrobium alkaliphilum]